MKYKVYGIEAGSDGMYDMPDTAFNHIIGALYVPDGTLCIVVAEPVYIVQGNFSLKNTEEKGSPDGE